MFIQILFTGLTLSSSYRWKISFCTTEDSMFSVILVVLLIASRTPRQMAFQLLRRKSKSEFSDHFNVMSFAHNEVLMLVAIS